MIREEYLSESDKALTCQEHNNIKYKYIESIESKLTIACKFIESLKMDIDELDQIDKILEEIK
jgi:hypothetical protein